MYQPPPLRARSVLDDKKVLLIDSHQLTRNACATVLRRYGVDVDTAEDLQAARSLWRPKHYNLILLDVRRCLPGEAFEFCEELRDASPRERFAFMVGPPQYLLTTWPTEFMARETEHQQWAETVKHLFNAA
jgi:CheY-like chemotaxis protein